jgi:hypothetical protein
MAVQSVAKPSFVKVLALLAPWQKDFQVKLLRQAAYSQTWEWVKI